MANKDNWTLEKMRQQSDEFITQIISGDRPGSSRRLFAERVWKERSEVKNEDNGGKKNKISTGFWTVLGVLVATLIGFLAMYTTQ